MRAAESEDPDFIEIELPGDNLTLDNLILVASSELGLKVNNPVKYLLDYLIFARPDWLRRCGRCQTLD